MGVRRPALKTGRPQSTRASNGNIASGSPGCCEATSSIQPITPFALAAYALVTGAAAVKVARREGAAILPIAWAAYPVMHVAHGVGFGAGLVRALVRPDWGPAPRIGDPEPV